ncbi:DUF3575 domain-containing protein [Flavobacterium sp.]|uniref:DUF3575 domain-containing protein n=1 Tax=Flavobacterium sp. TaxID=239 RepID=UPI0039E65D6D
MKKVLLFLLIPTALLAQEITPKPETSNEHSWAIKFNPLQAVDVFAFPTLTIGVEKRINRWFSLNAEAGYQCYKIEDDPKIVIYKQRGFKVNVEARSYVISMLNPNATKKASGLFVGLQPFLRRNQYTADDARYLPENHEIKFVDVFGVRKTSYGLNVSVGYQKATRHFIFEPYFAAGYMYRDIKNSGSGTYNDNSVYIQEYEEFNVSYDDSEESGHTGNLTLGIRFGYIF